jgi:hypothetical protein
MSRILFQKVLDSFRKIVSEKNSFRKFELVSECFFKFYLYVTL